MYKYCFLIVLCMSSVFCFSQEELSYVTPTDKMADVLINYSLELQPHERIAIFTQSEANELNIALYREALLAGAYPVIICEIPSSNEIFYTYANKDQLAYEEDYFLYIINNFDVLLNIGATSNTKSLNNVNPELFQITANANKKVTERFMERDGNNELRWCYATYPTDALAQEAEMGTVEYKEFVFNSCKLNTPDPAQSWEEDSKRQRELSAWLKGKDKIELKGPEIDLSLSIKDRAFLVADGKLNFPDGEIYCSPIENSANGWVKFSYPAIVMGKEIRDLELWFKNGKVVKCKASKGEELFSEMLKTDKGANVLGELGIGTNYSIKRFTKNMLYDEKIGGTIHLAVGNGFPDSGGKNVSSVHTDMVCNMKSSEIIVDGELFYKDGEFLK
ncbi:aminopeptidase [uncultured Draconibacterium sp.]|uniref:aminopeptidase n=1 Tax=uncultured Draconibacterium sp. TaxID=1573823 RepID=UPI0025E7A303|nr:aminopeptidase [uncultured Draconibacterium sp.]